MQVDAAGQKGRHRARPVPAALILCTLFSFVGPTLVNGTTPRTTCAPDASIRDFVRAKTNEQLAKGLFVLHVYGSGANSATPSQRRANISLYGQPTPGTVVAAWKPAGIIVISRNAQDVARPQLASGNVLSALQLRRFTSDLRRADANLLVGIDQEGGRVNRLKLIVGSVSPAASVGESEEATRVAAASTASQLRANGVNVNFAPVADIVLPDTPPNGIIGDRSFGTDASVVAQRVVTTIDAFQRDGVAAVAKHWPGHGSSPIDSHKDTPVLAFERSDVAERNLRPFGAAIEAGVAAVMVGHLAVPAWDRSRRPATISKPILRRLRSAFCGVIVTDSLWMGGVRRFGSDSSIAFEAAQSGADLLLMPVNVAAAVARLTEAANRDPEFRTRLLDASLRVETLRRRFRA